MNRTAFLLTLAVALAAPIEAAAQQVCGNREAIVERLAAKWGESFTGGGMQNASSIIEVWMSAEKGTWTILRTAADGTACIMAAGTNWMQGYPAEQVAGIEG